MRLVNENSENVREVGSDRENVRAEESEDSKNVEEVACEDSEDVEKSKDKNL